MLFEGEMVSVSEKSGTVVPLKVFKNREVAEGEGGPRRELSTEANEYGYLLKNIVA